MFDLFLDSLLDGLKDGAWSLPVLFVAYLLMELLERSQKLNEEILHGYSHKAGPLLGGLLGVVPQCGISGAAATLFSTGSVTVGTMLAVFFATSDEMLPIMLSSVADGDIRLSSILLIVLGKAALGVALGYLADLLLTKYIRSQKNIHGFCEREHCACDEEEGNVFVSALKHTLKIAVMLIAVNVVLNFVLGMIGVERLSGSVLNRPFIGEILLALVGLIPNCSVSVVITESYLSGLIGLGGLFAGLLSNAGIGLLVLFRTNKNLKENLVITSTLYGLSAAAGIVITLVSGLL
ncbi:MAG: arsenic efflux protein [Clostridiales bacterium]|nr:arsenic efflux protein [Clostridiales bacterium]